MKYDKVDLVSFMDVILETFLTDTSTDYSFERSDLRLPGGLLPTSWIAAWRLLSRLICSVTH